MSYTPSMDELREAWLTAEYEERGHGTSDDDLRAEFDRALAAHDAEVRAGVVAEEPEWEYGIALFGEMDDIQQWPTEAKALAARQDAVDLLIRRRKAGPWVPVKQEGAEIDG